MKNYLQPLQRFFHLEAAAGLVLFLAAGIAVLLSNSPWSESYQAFWKTPLNWPLLALSSHPPLFWINEGLMTLFFFLVGLELKRELISGELSEPSKLLLPILAALGGMLFPALIYSLFNYQHPDTYAGWAIPVATDIAFALGVLSLLGKRIPPNLKLFLIALAIFDDLGAILIIACFYARYFAWLPFISAMLLICLASLVGRLRLPYFWPYLLLGCLLWFLFLQAGIHPTIAGVVLAFLIPYRGEPNALLERIEARLHPWAAYLIMPLFALANAGFSFAKDASLMNRSDQLALGAFVGLFIGKPLGIFSFSWFSVHAGLAKLPQGISWMELWGISILCGIGFTMSLFLGTLAFTYSDLYMSEVRLGVFLGSILSGIIGAAILFWATRWKGNAK